MNKLIYLAQIGCGYWGPNLLRNFAALPQCQVKYVIEQSPERRLYVETNFSQTKASPDLSCALHDTSVKAVVIATPARSHFSLAKAALEHGKDTFVEKPLAMTVAEVDELAALATEKKLVLMVGHTFLYNSAVEYLKRLLQGGECGQIYYAYAQRLNLGVIRSDVNAMWNLAPHDISILCYLFENAPVSVAAFGTEYIQPKLEDVVFLNLEFPGKLRANIHVSWLDPRKVRRMTVVGSKKMVVYDDVADDKIIIYDKGIDREDTGSGMPFDTVTPGKFVHRAGDIYIPRIPSKEPLRVQAEHFVHCIRSGEQPLTGADHARQVVGVLAAAQHSLENGGLRTCPPGPVGTR